ncbi:unnamed protein product [Brassica oleracea]
MRMWCGTVHGRWSWPTLCFSLKETTKRQLLIDSSFQTQSFSGLSVILILRNQRGEASYANTRDSR